MGPPGYRSSWPRSRCHPGRCRKGTRTCSYCRPQERGALLDLLSASEGGGFDNSQRERVDLFAVEDDRERVVRRLRQRELLEVDHDLLAARQGWISRIPL